MEIDLRDLLSMLWGRKWLILAVSLGVCLGALLITLLFVTPMYTASISMYVSNNEDRTSASITAGDLSASQSLVDTYIVVLKSSTLLTKVREQLPAEYDGSVAAIRKMLTANAIDGTEAFAVSITNADPQAAQTIVNTIAAVAPAEIVRVVRAGEVAVIDYAELPEKADWPLARNAALGLLLGLLASCLGVVLYHVLDVTVHTAEDLTGAFSLPVLGEIPTIVSVGTEAAEKRENDHEKADV